MEIEHDSNMRKSFLSGSKRFSTQGSFKFTKKEGGFDTTFG